ncbi:branched-chain amino acid ABC transporter permease [Rhodoligotrophos defluvii]|uniref:branched-chain amino acid ABC transporter permease n=1 Tax=Rhodoligotrophos defluvii TaxID=2561934 RepID=UPI0010C98FA7|nr:branched-chain amino acid ABC transporter permease [Rhodoligotrophos defluvii]
MARPAIWTGALLALVLLAIPGGLLALDQGYLFRLAHLSMIFIILSASLNLVSGTAGLLSLAQAAFYGIGAYVAAIASTQFGLPFLVTLPAAMLFSGAFAFLTGIPAIRLVRIFFTVATLSIGEIITLAITNWYDVTRGPLGIRGISPIEIFGIDLSSRLATYYVIAVVMLASLWMLHRITHSYYGNALRALREDDQSAEAMGINANLLKIQAFAIAGAFAGLSGALLAHSTRYISPDMFRLPESILVLTMVVVGGLGSLPGAIIGALIMILLPELGREVGELRMILVGIVLFIAIVAMPRGLFSETAAIAFVRRWFGCAWRPGRDGKAGIGWK